MIPFRCLWRYESGWSLDQNKALEDFVMCPKSFYFKKLFGRVLSHHELLYKNAKVGNIYFN